MESAVPEPIPIRQLTSAIEADPDAPVNYLLRGEEWLLRGNWERARADLEIARTRSMALLAQSSWGYIYQSYIDRAEAGLRRCGANEK